MAPGAALAAEARKEGCAVPGRPLLPADVVLMKLVLPGLVLAVRSDFWPVVDIVPVRLDIGHDLVDPDLLERLLIVAPGLLVCRVAVGHI